MMGKLFNKLYFSSLLGILLLIMPHCNKTEVIIPYVIVNFSLDLTIINELKTPGYSKLYPYEGYGGVIVYCEFYDVVTPNASVYYAYDATCTYELNDTCSIINEGNSITAVCPCCGSEFHLNGGYPFKGKATAPLKMYNATILNNKLIVSN